MKRLFCLLSSVIAFCIPQLPGQDTLQLFNQEDLNGWYAFSAETGKVENASALFQVEEKHIRMFGEKAGYLMSEQSFSAFELTVEYRWNADSTYARKSNKMNSGVMYLVPTDFHDTLWPKGYQFQVKQNATGDFILLQGTTLISNGERTIPGRSVKVKKLQDNEKLPGEWNTIQISVSNDSIQHFLNGKLVNKGTSPNVKNGRILLQYEGFPIDFKRVEIVPVK